MTLQEKVEELDSKLRAIHMHTLLATKEIQKITKKEYYSKGQQALDYVDVLTDYLASVQRQFGMRKK